MIENENKGNNGVYIHYWALPVGYFLTFFILVSARFIQGKPLYFSSDANRWMFYFMFAVSGILCMINLLQWMKKQK